MSTQPTLTARHTRLVTDYLDALFARKISAASDIHPRYETLWREIARVSAHGKRLRPHMVLLAYEALLRETERSEADVSAIVPAAAATELLHVSMLIHDDIIDRDLMRHGQPTVQAAYEARYAVNIADPHERRHNAIGAAILAGDLLLNEARSLVTKCTAPADLVRQAGYAFDTAVFEVAGGELLDVESTFAPRGTIDPLLITTYKTAGYSFIGPLVIGATLAGADADGLKHIRNFGLHLGVAYQLADDILGIFGDTSETGKPNDGDIREGKGTYLVERFYNLADSRTGSEFEKIYGKHDVDENECRVVRQMLTDSGALAETRSAISHHAVQARRALEQLGLPAEYAQRFEELITLSTERSA